MFEEDVRDLKIATLNYQDVKNNLTPINDEELASLYENYKEFYKLNPELKITLLTFNAKESEEVEKFVDSENGNQKIFDYLSKSNKPIDIDLTYVGGKFYVGPDNEKLSDEITDYVESFANNSFNQVNAYSEINEIDNGDDKGKFVFAKISKYNPSMYRPLEEIKADLIKRLQLQDYGNNLVNKIIDSANLDVVTDEYKINWVDEKSVSRSDAMFKGLDKAFKLPWPKTLTDKEFYAYGDLESPDTYKIVVLEKVSSGNSDNMEEDFKNYFNNLYNQQQLESVINAYLLDISNDVNISIYIKQ
jgi:hypothetical protein